MFLAAVLAMALAFAAPALAQSSDPQVVADAVNHTANAGGPAGANADANCKDGIIDSKAGGVEAKAPCKPPPPPPPPPAPAPKAAPAPPPPPAPAPPAPAPAPMLPATGGISLIALGTGVLLVGGGLLARRIVK
jgi:hypothetical protein